MIRFWLYVICVLATVGLAACDATPLETTPEELAERIRRNTPTELPPITTEGLNTMGAWIHPQPGSELHRIEGDSFLFVASGVERPSQFNTVSGSCDAFSNLYFGSQRLTSIRGQFCPRPEIGDPRRISMLLSNFTDSLQLSLLYIQSPNLSTHSYWLPPHRDPNDLINIDFIEVDESRQLISAVFSGLLINRDDYTDSIQISMGRLDATYSTTP